MCKVRDIILIRRREDYAETRKMGVIFMKSLVYVPFLLELYTICLAVSKMQSASAVILSEQKAFGVL